MKFSEIKSSHTLFESVVNVEHGQMIAINVRKALLCLVGRLLHLSWPDEYLGNLGVKTEMFRLSFIIKNFHVG